MPLPQLPEPRIKFLFEGVLALGVAQGRSFFHAGIIRGVNGDGEIPGHNYSITVAKVVNDVEVERTTIVDRRSPAAVLRLELGNAPSLGIQLFHPVPTNTPDGIRDASNHFDWVLDVENNMHNGRAVTPINTALRSVLQVSGIDVGHFYAWDVNRGAVHLQEDVANPPLPTLIDGSAGSVAAVVRLPVGGAEIQRFNSLMQPIGVPHPLPNNIARLTYEISVRNVCQSENCSHEGNLDFYNGLIGQPAHGNRVRFVKRPPRNPQAVFVENTELTGCPTINFGISAALPNPAR